MKARTHRWVLGLALSPWVLAQSAAQAPAAQTPAAAAAFNKEQLEQMVAPMALYPLEIVRASRWVEANPMTVGTPPVIEAGA